MVSRIIFILGFSSFSALWSQGYYPEKYTNGNPKSIWTGKALNLENDAADDKTSNWQLVLDPMKSDTWSKTQLMSINFSFDGNPVVAFKASNTGIITFDTTVTSNPLKGFHVLPQNAIPNKSSVILGLHGIGDNDKVVCKVFGPAPYRQLWIKFLSFSPATDSLGASNLTTAVVFEETSNRIFLVLMNENHLSGASNLYKLNPGIQTDKFVASPLNNNGNSYGFPVSSKADDNYYYEFNYGFQNVLDLELGIAETKSNIKAGTNADVTYYLANNSGVSVDSTVLYYQFDGGSVSSEKIKFNWLAGRENIYTGKINGITINGPAGATHELVMWINKANNITETITNNDTQKIVFLAVNGTQSTGQVLMESATAAWCGVCPGNNLKMDRWKEKYGDTIILVQHHQLDEMAGNNDALFDAYFDNTPGTLINRSAMPNLDSAAKNLDKAIHEIRMAPATVNVQNMSLNESTGELKYSVLVKFEDYFQGTLNVGGLVLEDNVRGSGAGFNQTINDTLTNDTKDWFYRFSNPINGYYHQHVAWHIHGGARGQELAYKSYAPGDTVLLDFFYTIPQLLKPAVILASPYLPVGDIISSGKPADIQAVGFATYTESGKEYFINAGLTPLWNTNLSVGNKQIANWNLYPNPASDHIVLQAVNQMQRLEIVDMAGNKLFVANADYQNIPEVISLGDCLKTAGIYFVRVTDSFGNTGGKKLIYMP
ncbi:MAG: T9SS type A sorting domain-containing protein [Bacteroidetes bacterium]|nr:T9SS type A sorting domain-containing protein [Bacteroidota bacterium]